MHFAPQDADTDPRFDTQQPLGVNWKRLAGETFFALVAGVTTALVLEIIQERRSKPKKVQHRALILED